MLFAFWGKGSHRFSEALFHKEGMVIDQQRDMLADDAWKHGALWEGEQFAVGMFWLLIAVCLLLLLCQASVWSGAPHPFSAGWGGGVVLYYALRSMLRRPVWAGKMRQRMFPVWRAWRCFCCWQAWQGFPVASVGDLCMISLAVWLSGGWGSPLSLLYFGWAITLAAESSWVYRLLGSVLAPLLWLGAVLLAARSSLSPEQEELAAEHLLLLIGVCLGVSALRLYLDWNKRRWAAERQQWKLLRQTVFLQLAHELFTPLSAIQTSTALLAGEAGGVCLADKKRRQLCEVIERNCRRMSLLLDGLLVLWRRGGCPLPSEVKSVGCFSVAQGVAQTLQPLFEAKKQECVVVAEPSAVAAWANKQQLEQVLVNLLSNAQKYSPLCSRVLVEIRGGEDEVRFAVRDEGPGIAYEEQVHLFDLGFRGAQACGSTRGAGLGLALAKALVVAQGGRIWVESRPGQGSTFYFTLPRAPLGPVHPLVPLGGEIFTR